MSNLMMQFKALTLSFKAKDFDTGINQVDKIDLLINIKDKFFFFKLCEVQDVIRQAKH